MHMIPITMKFEFLFFKYTMLLHLLLLEVVSVKYYVTENTNNIYYPEDVGQNFDRPDYNKEHLLEQHYQRRADYDNDADKPINDANNYDLESAPIFEDQTVSYGENYINNNVDSLGSINNNEGYNFELNDNVFNNNVQPRDVSVIVHDDPYEGHNFELNDNVYNDNAQPRDVSFIVNDDPYEYIDYGHKYVRGRTTNKKTTKTTKKTTMKTAKTTTTKKTAIHIHKPTTKTTKIITTPKSTTTEKKLDHYAYERKSTYDESQNSFGSLPEYEIRATRVEESQYPWLARVVHSRSKHYPHVATAACVDTRIFITSAKSVFSLKVPYTSVIYSGKQAPVIAIVLPSNPSKLYYDDIGILVVKEGFIFNWHTVKIFQAPRTDIYFNWFEDRNLNENGPLHHKAVGYAHNQNISSLASVAHKHELMEIDVVLGLEICVVAYTSLGNGLHGYHVPCYYPCTPKELFNVVTNKIDNSNCAKYLGVSGAVVYDTKTNILMGIATWGEVAPNARITLPVGVAIPNSKTFLSDYECAKRIRNDKKHKVYSGYYGSLCET